jgi:hypothetical protein
MSAAFADRAVYARRTMGMVTFQSIEGQLSLLRILLQCVLEMKYKGFRSLRVCYFLSLNDEAQPLCAFLTLLDQHNKLNSSANLVRRGLNSFERQASLGILEVHILIQQMTQRTWHTDQVPHSPFAFDGLECSERRSTREIQEH